MPRGRVDMDDDVTCADKGINVTLSGFGFALAGSRHNAANQKSKNVFASCMGFAMQTHFVNPCLKPDHHCQNRQQPKQKLHPYQQLRS